MKQANVIYIPKPGEDRFLLVHKDNLADLAGQHPQL